MTKAYKIREVYRGGAVHGDDVGDADTFSEALAIATATPTKCRAIFLGTDLIWPRDVNSLENPKPKFWPRIRRG